MTRKSVPLVREELPAQLRDYFFYDTQRLESVPDGRLTTTGNVAKRLMVDRVCRDCDKRYAYPVSFIRSDIKRYNVQPLCKECTSKQKHDAKGWVNSNGYREIYMPERSTTKSGAVLEHRYVIEKELERPLESYEQVHHINGDRADNRLENLQLRSTARGSGVKNLCLNCGSANIRAVTI